MDSLVEDMSSDHLMIAFRRAAILVGGRPDVDCPTFKREFSHQLARIAATDVLNELKDLGIATITTVDSDGERVWDLAAA